MKELNDIILAYDRALSQDKKMALATVVRVDGSSYRRPGARMLVTEDGEITGAISGGCLEGDALRKAQFAIFQEKNKLEIYDTMDDEDNRLGVQLGCNGIVYILFEPIRRDDVNNPVNLLKKILADRENVVLITIFNENKWLEQKGTVNVFHGDETFSENDVLLKIEAACNDALVTRSSALTSMMDGSTALLQFVPPPLQLVIIGAGNDVQPLVEMCYLLGWTIIVIDGRPRYATARRFSKAKSVMVAKPEAITSLTNIDHQTAVVLMTHNYNYDVAALEQLINTNCRYIGMLGPKNKLEKMLDELTGKGLTIKDDVIHKLYGPVGLDIGAETSEEIALSIVAEIKAVFSDSPATFLRAKKTQIHKPTSNFLS